VADVAGGCGIDCAGGAAIERAEMCRGEATEEEDVTVKMLLDAAIAAAASVVDVTVVSLLPEDVRCLGGLRKVVRRTACDSSSPASSSSLAFDLPLLLLSACLPVCMCRPLVSFSKALDAVILFMTNA